jgi:hypothetical protein
MSNIKGIRSDVWYKMKYHQPLDLTITMEGTGSATAVLLGKQIIVTVVAGQINKYVNISTPLGFRVINGYSIHTDNTNSSWQLVNTAAAIHTAVEMAASDTDIDKMAQVNDANNIFARGDDDLRVEITTGEANCIIVIDIEPTVA